MLVLPFDHPSLRVALAAEAVALGVLLVCVSRVVRRTSPTPPGPKGYPVIGLTFTLFKDHTFKRLAQWHKEHGSLIFARILGKPIAFVSDFEVADQLLNKRCAALSNRPISVMTQLTMYNRALTLLQPGHRFNRSRRQIHDALNARAIPAQHRVLEKASTDFISALKSSPDEFISHVHFYYSKTLLSSTIGYQAVSKDDAMVTLSRQVTANGLSMISLRDRSWVEFFPTVAGLLPEWCMGAMTSSTIQRYREDINNLLARSEDFIQSNFHERDVGASFLGTLLAKSDSEEETSIAKWSTVSMYGGGTDPLRSLTASFFMAIMLYPEAQARAQAEIDAVVGRDRMPVFSDRPRLPYTEALMVEILRWAPPIPFTSRTVSEDMAYGDYVLPQGTTLIANIWGMLHNPDRFPEPAIFDPGRFYDPDNGRNAAFLQTSTRHIHHIVFGFGRRVCPGKFYGDALLWIVITSVLAAFKVSVPDGEPPPDVKFTVEPIIHLEPFACKIEPRAPGVV
ncbi:cytochrome P450 [Ganoderma leucocontextum]|nr:cytochrome P450 [Ganoderma leucocontextum]